MAALRIFLADDHEIVRFGLRTLLEIQGEWMIVGEASDGAAAIEGVMACEPDIAIIDIGMPVMDGLTAARKISAGRATTKILILSLHDSKNVMRQVVDSGAKGFVLKSDAARDLIAAVEAIQAGGTFFTPKTAEIILDRQLDRMQEEQGRSRAGSGSNKKSPIRHH
ncbi:MAG TPA: response regulator transcription factor [Candidatus Acidoferrum sp.]|jgi:DNA-binding NarL/FixJ family response regulator